MTDSGGWVLSLFTLAWLAVLVRFPNVEGPRQLPYSEV